MPVPGSSVLLLHILFLSVLLQFSGFCSLIIRLLSKCRICQISTGIYCKYAATVYAVDSLQVLIQISSLLDIEGTHLNTRIGNSNIIELQGTGEGRPFSVEEAAQLVELCRKGNQVLQQKQKEILGELV